MSYPGFTCIADPKQCIGKTVAGAIQRRGQIGFTFADKTYFFCEVEDQDSEIDTAYGEPDPWAALEMGIIDQEEFDRMMQEMAAVRRQVEQAQYQALKAKFEPDGKESSP